MESIRLPPGAHPAELYPLSEGQKGLLYEHLRAPESSAYNGLLVAHLTSSLCVERFTRAVQSLFERHPSLRARCEVREAEPVQVIKPPGGMALPEVDATGWPELRVRRWIHDLQTRPYDLARGPLYRLALLRRAPRDHLFVFAVHHLTTDGQSYGVFMQELTRLYDAGDGAALPPPTSASFPDFVRWERELLDGPQGKALEDFWRRRIDGAPRLLELPLRREPPPESAEEEREFLELDPALFAQVNALSRSLGVPFARLVIAAIQLALHRFAGQGDLLAGMAVGRRSRPELAELYGYIVNQVPLRTTLGPRTTFRALCRQVHERMDELVAHSDLPLPALLQRLQIPRGEGRHPLYQVSYNVLKVRGFDLLFQRELPAVSEGTDAAELAVDSLIIDQPLPPGTDLLVWTGRPSHTLQIRLAYRPQLFERALVARLLAAVPVLLEAAVRDPDASVHRLPLVAPEEARRLAATHRPPAPDRPLCLGEAFARRAAEQPSAPALLHGDRVVTYAELEERSSRLAHRLRALGLSPGERAALSIARSPDMVVAILAVLKAGAAYVPLDPDYPPDRLAFMLRDSGARLLISERRADGRWAEAAGPAIPRVFLEDEEALAPAPLPPFLAASPDLPAYVIYTSGSTGQPKGVVVTHRNLAHLAAGQRHLGYGGPGARTLQFASLSFDASVWELLTLVHGGALVLAGAADVLDGNRLIALMRAQKVTCAVLPPSALRALPLEPLPELRMLFVAGEPCPQDLVARWSPGRTFINAYGPTEATVCSTAGACDPREPRPTIGAPLEGVRAYVLDGALAPVPRGVAGELYVGGGGIALGYLGRPDLTAERFVPDPFSGEPGARLYRTGDRVRQLEDGRFEYAGRVDRQIKHRGFRIELGEIESALREHPSAADCAAALWRAPSGEALLACYLVPRGAAPDEDELRRWARSRLPAFMVPEVFALLTQIPLSPSGKVDRDRLPDPRSAPVPRAAERTPPKSELERAVAAAWREVLGVDRVGREDNFFDLGGHSLLLLRVQRALQARTGQELPVAELLRSPTVAALAARLAGDDLVGGPGPLALENSDGAQKRRSLSADRERAAERRRSARRGPGGTA